MTKILAIGDVHGDINLLSYVMASNVPESYDAVFLSGDLGSDIIGNAATASDPLRRDLYHISVKAVLDTVTVMGHPAYFVPGNRDTPGELPMSDGATNVDLVQRGEFASLGSLAVAGVGGCNWIQGEWPYEWHEEPTLHKFKERMFGVSLEQLILLSHSPPHDSQLDIEPVQLRHVGSRTVRILIEDLKPRLCVCGHIHESAGVDMVGNTPVVNVGSLVSSSTRIKAKGPDARVIEWYPAEFFLIDLDDSGHIGIRHLCLVPAMRRKLRVAEYEVRRGKLTRSDYLGSNPSEGTQIVTYLRRSGSARS